MDGVIDEDEKIVCSKRDNQFKIKLEGMNHTLFMTKMAKINTLFKSKPQKTYPLGPHMYSPYKGVPPSPFPC